MNALSVVGLFLDLAFKIILPTIAAVAFAVLVAAGIAFWKFFSFVIAVGIVEAFCKTLAFVLMAGIFIVFWETSNDDDDDSDIESAKTPLALPSALEPVEYAVLVRPRQSVRLSLAAANTTIDLELGTSTEQSKLELAAAPATPLSRCLLAIEAPPAPVVLARSAPVTAPRPAAAAAARPPLRHTSTSARRSLLSMPACGTDDQVARRSPAGKLSKCYYARVEPIVIGKPTSCTEVDIAKISLDEDLNHALKDSDSVLDDHLADRRRDGRKIIRPYFNRPNVGVLSFPSHRYYHCLSWHSRSDPAKWQANCEEARLDRLANKEWEEAEAAERIRKTSKGRFVKRGPNVAGVALFEHEIHRDGVMIGSVWIPVDPNAWATGAVDFGTRLDDSDSDCDSIASSISDSDASSSSDEEAEDDAVSPALSSSSWADDDREDGTLPELPADWLDQDAFPLPPSPESTCSDSSDSSTSPVSTPETSPALSAKSWDEAEGGLPDLPADWL